MANLINRSVVKRILLERHNDQRPHHQMTQVSKEAIDWVESNVLKILDKLIEQQPRVGRTIKPY